MPGYNLAKRKKWKKKLETWEQSGLSAQKWCRENHEKYAQFCYWKAILISEKLRPVFEELKENPLKTLELEIRLGDITIAFPKGCTPDLLKHYLKVISQC